MQPWIRVGVELFTRPFLPSPFSPRPCRKGLGTKLTHILIPLLSLMNCSSACIAATASEGPTLGSPPIDDLNCCTSSGCVWWDMKGVVSSLNPLTTQQHTCNVQIRALLWNTHVSSKVQHGLAPIIIAHY